ncbi:phage portal protein [Dyella sp.]|uniref:phage portal protein n=1 Tax=Dyella sp. TaxID=1869338 RepID=UPI002841A805|nr:phage portal protein [Dyella sp.]MDR3444476.1 phage portal protein [Dyella sp.]
MSKRKPRTEQAKTTKDTTAGGRFEAFTFGDPEPIDRANLLDYVQVWHNSRWYEPPVSLTGLANMLQIAPHHSSAIYIKRNLLVALFEPSRYLSVAEFEAFAMDYLTFGQAYLECDAALSGRLLTAKHTPALFTRRGVVDGKFWFVPLNGQAFEFERAVVQMKAPDVRQEVYGIPEYLSALHAAQLNRSATLFRRKYYDNGSHAGFILYMTDPAQNPEDVDNLRKALKGAKGPGNFRNLFMYAPSGKKDGLQLIPISEVAAKDDFASIKNASRDDILAAHRVPPQLLGMIPTNAGGFGDVGKARDIFVANEVAPIQARMLGLNESLGAEVFRFKSPA